MKDRLPRRSATLLLSASLIAGAPIGAVAQSESALDAALAAVGGADALAALGGYAIKASGTRAALDEGPTPGGAPGLGGPFRSATTADLASDSHRIDYTIEATEAGGPRDVSEIVAGGVGYLDGTWANVAPPGQVPMSPDRVTSTVTHQQLLNPHLLLLGAMADPTMASGDGDTLEIAHGQTPITLSLSDGVIAEARTMENDPLRRDVEVVVSYDEWTETDAGVSFPHAITISYDGAIVHEERRAVIADPDLDIDLSFFAIPEGMRLPDDADLAARGDLSHQYIQNFAAIGFPRDGLQLTVEATEIAPGVFHLAGGTHHSMAVVQDDGIVIADAPLDETRSVAIREWLAAELPDLPVTHVVQSHHHVDHAGGLRSLAGSTGATVVAGAAAVPFYEQEAFTAPSTIVPDDIDGSAIETLAVGTEPVVIGSGTNAVTVVGFPNPHADDYVLVEAGGALWVVDIHNPGFGAPLPDAIADFVEGSGLDVSVVVGGHGSSEPWPGADAA